MTEVEDDNSDKQILNIILLSTLGWTPNNGLIPAGEGRRRFSPKFFFFLFVTLLDFADALFDVILSVQTMMFGSEEEEGARIGLGLLLFFTTVFGRILPGLYGWFVMNNIPRAHEVFFFFAVMEMGVCFSWRTELPF